MAEAALPQGSRRWTYFTLGQTNMRLELLCDGWTIETKRKCECDFKRIERGLERTDALKRAHALAHALERCG